jgi:cyclophilin family peptidyl-prolyl cis-trans isomerase
MPTHSKAHRRCLLPLNFAAVLLAAMTSMLPFSQAQTPKDDKTAKTYTEELRQQFENAIRQEHSEHELFENRAKSFGVWPANVPDELRTKYDLAFSDFRNALLKLQLTQLQHHVAWSTDRDQERLEQYSLDLYETQSRLNVWRQAIAEVYLADKDSTSKFSEMIVEMIQRDTARDMYEGLEPMAQAFLDRQQDIPASLLESIGYIGYANNNHDLAEAAWSRLRKTASVPQGIELALEGMAAQREKWNEELSRRAADEKRNDNPRVVIQTNKGRIVVELFEEEAPQAVANFIFLVERGFYRRKMFFRVVEHFAAQSGCERGDGTGNAGYTIPGEMAAPNHRNIFRGSMVLLSGIDQATNRPNPDSGSSQFLFTMLPQPLFDGHMTVFGRIIEGLPVLGALNRVDFSKEEERKDKSKRADTIIDAKVLRKRDHSYVPKVSGGRLP